MRSVWKALAVVGGGVVVCYGIMFGFMGVLRAYLGPFAVIVPVLAGAAVWYVGVRFWIDAAPRTVLERRRLGLCERCGYDPRGNVGGVCPECGAEVVTRGAPPPLPGAGKR